MNRFKSAAVSFAMLGIVALSWAVTAPGRAWADRPNGTGSLAQTLQTQWTMPPEYRAVQRASLASQRNFLQAMADSMPEGSFDVVDNPGQRSFAEHVYHAAVANAQAVDRFIDGPAFDAPDPATAVASRSELKEAVDRGFDYIESLLDAQSESDRQASMQFAGRSIPGWQFWDELNEHTYWTLGEIVGNFRSLGMAPPAFRFF